MTKISAIGLGVDVNEDGYDLTGGSTDERKLGVTGADIAMVGSGTETYTFPGVTSTLAKKDLDGTPPADHTSEDKEMNTLNAGESVTIYQIPKEDSSPSESSHVNLSRMLSLACVDYVKAMLSDFDGELDKKEYYMREFWKKVGDNESNRRMVAMSFPMKSYSVI